jgi:hypothetical protein
MKVDEDLAGAEAEGLTGRRRELGELLRLARVSRAVTLCGGGGLGKTSLIQALAAALAPDYPDGTFVVSLADLHSRAWRPAGSPQCSGWPRSRACPRPRPWRRR